MRKAVIAGLAILAVAAGLVRADPIRVEDALGRTVTLPAPPQRIVTIFSSNTELVAALGLTDRIVGIDAFTRYPAEAAASTFSVSERTRRLPSAWRPIASCAGRSSWPPWWSRWLWPMAAWLASLA